MDLFTDLDFFCQIHKNSGNWIFTICLPKYTYPTISHLLIRFSDEKDEPKSLEPGDYQLYTWENPMGKRELTWNSGEAKNKKDTLVKVKYFCAARK